MSTVAPSPYRTGATADQLRVIRDLSELQVLSLAAALNARHPEVCVPSRSWPARLDPEATRAVAVCTPQQRGVMVAALAADPRVGNAGVRVYPLPVERRRWPTPLEVWRGVECCRPAAVAYWRRVRRWAIVIAIAAPFVLAYAAVLWAPEPVGWLAIVLLGGLLWLMVHKGRHSMICPKPRR